MNIVYFQNKLNKLALLSFCLLLVACQNKAIDQRPNPLLQDSLIQVYMNHNQAKGADYQEPYRGLKRTGDNLEEVIIDGIRSSRVSIDLAVQEFRLPKIAQVLAERHQAGVKIRVIVENTYRRPWSSFSPSEIKGLSEDQQGRYKEFVALADRDRNGTLSPKEINEGDALIILEKAGIPIIDDTKDGSKGTGLMHHKFMVVDNSLIITGSANYTTSDIHGDFHYPQSRGNANNLLRIQDATLARIFTEEFNLMWGDGVGSKFGIKKPDRPPQTVVIGNSKVTVHFSPASRREKWTETSNGLIGKNLAKAKASVKMALFVFSEQPLADLLEKRHQQGVKIAALIDPGFAYREYSEGLDMLGVTLAAKCPGEKGNHPWQNPITTVGIPNLAQGDKLHHKFGAIDGKITITGSHNWTVAGNHTNDETLLVIESPIITAHYEREFDRLEQEAIFGIPQKLQGKIRTCAPTKNKAKSGGKINLNTASQADLETLPGVSTKLAQRIIKVRNQQPFTSLEDFDRRVPGVGEKLRQKLESHVTW